MSDIDEIKSSVRSAVFEVDPLGRTRLQELLFLHAHRCLDASCDRYLVLWKKCSCVHCRVARSVEKLIREIQNRAWQWTSLTY